MQAGCLKSLYAAKELGKFYKYIEEGLKKSNEQRTGRLEIVPEKVFINFDENTTEPETVRLPEYHKDFLDIHVILEGCERIGFRTAPVNLDNNDLPKDKESEPYNKERDIGFLDKETACSYVDLKVGDYAVFAPEELHKPLCFIDGPLKIRKMIIKIHKDLLV